MKTSRRELLEWLKSLNIRINKIEEIGQGAALCQLLSIIHPDVHFNYIKEPTSNYEYLRNLKTAQSFFQENNVDVRFPIEKLVLCKLQDNLEIAQWMYKYYIKHIKKENKLENKVDSKKDSKIENKVDSKIEIKKEFNIDEDVREKNRQEIIENLKKHYEEKNIKLEDKYKQVIEDNKSLTGKIKEQEEEINKLKEKMGIFADNDVQKIIKELEDNRDFYFLILVEVEKYLTECEKIEESVKNDIFDILYKK